MSRYFELASSQTCKPRSFQLNHRSDQEGS